MKRWLLLGIGLITLLLSACTGVSNTTPERQATGDGTSYKTITVTQLKSMLDNKDFLLVNVHIPYAGEIQETDLFVPYNAIEQNLSKLPTDQNARIVVYCRSGAMSSIAAKTLVGLGYTNITDVAGGMIAWEQAGYQLIQTP